MKKIIYVLLMCFIIFIIGIIIKGFSSLNKTSNVLNYDSNTLKIGIEPIVKNNDLRMWVTTIKVKDAKQIKSAFAGDEFSLTKKEKTSSIAKRHNAILAVNGAACGFNTTGMVIRDGKTYRSTSMDFAPLVIKNNGDFIIHNYCEKSATQLIAEGAMDTYDFGPDLIKNGEIVDWSKESNSSNDWYHNLQDPHTAIGQCGPLQYIIITVDGRSSISKGMSYANLAEEFKKRGCNWAYNLDGGGSTTLYYQGKVINHPSDLLGERAISDILYFTD